MPKRRAPVSRKARIERDDRKPKLSPLLRFGLEVLDHGLWHFFRSETSLDMKFAILHVDQAVELFLKAKVLDAGETIYRAKSKETIGVWECFEVVITKLRSPIPEKADLEFLHDERNKIQHGTASPSVDDAAYMIERGLRFFGRFLNKEFGIDIAEYIPSEYLDQFDIGSNSSTSKVPRSE